MFDLVIRDGLIVDGTGKPAYRGDVAVSDGRIAEVGRQAGPGRREIRAGGQLITPGFVDVHTHYDGQATWDGQLAPSSWHGVTTIVMGNCSVGFAPVRPDQHDFLIEMMEGVEDIPGIALHEGISWEWETFPDYLDHLDRVPRAIDVGAQATHAAMRAYVMGDRGAANEPATADDLSSMTRMVREAIHAGALGLTSSRADVHRTSKGAHIPGYGVGADELVALAQAVGETGKGAIGVNLDFLDEDDDFGLLRRLKRVSSRPVWFLLTQMNDDPQKYARLLDRMAQSTAEGEEVLCQVAGRPIGFLLGLESSLNPFISRPSYKRIANLSLAERVTALRDPEFRAQLMSERRSHKSDIMRTVTTRFDRMFRLGDPPDYEPPAEASIAAKAEREGLDPQEVALDVLLERDGHELLFMPALNYAEGDFGAIERMMAHPNAILGLSDGGAHCGLICDASTPTYMLSHWARDRSRGPKISLEAAVRKQTSETAALYGLNDRGRVAEGYKADLNVIDFEHLRLCAPEMVYDLPAGGRRLVQRAEGFRAIVNGGEVTFENGEATGAMPGRLVRGGQAAPATR
ncbi:MAG: amidohydrolase [Rhizobiales bacterium NRL2]|jgi:N-acyl-D-aspartate/D-glutamate deacylase|nr:MAG: amidohydrolase [Rhizobiales bacterium NRL2]